MQQVITEVSQEWIEKHGMAWDYYDEEAMKFFATFPDREVIQLSADEMARWVAAVQPLVAAAIADKTAKGLPAADYETYINGRVAYWSAKSPTAAESVDWVKQELEPLQAK